MLTSSCNFVQRRHSSLRPDSVSSQQPKAEKEHKEIQACQKINIQHVFQFPDVYQRFWRSQTRFSTLVGTFSWDDVEKLHFSASGQPSLHSTQQTHSMSIFKNFNFSSSLALFHVAEKSHSLAVVFPFLSPLCAWFWLMTSSSIHSWNIGKCKNCLERF